MLSPWKKSYDKHSILKSKDMEKEMATHSSVLAWRIPGMGEPGWLLPLGSQSRTQLKRLSSSSSSSNPLQYSGLENSMDCVVHGVTKSQTLSSNFHFYVNATFFCLFKILFSILLKSKNNQDLQFREFPGSPVVRTQHFHCHGPGSIPGQETQISWAEHYQAKKKKDL